MNAEPLPVRAWYACSCGRVHEWRAIDPPKALACSYGGSNRIALQQPIMPGIVFEVDPFPFVRHTASVPDADGEFEDVECWKPGTRYETRLGGYGEPDTYTVADGVGALRLTVVSVHTPPGFPQRVFYLRTWRDPDGKTFGRRRLLMTTTQAFRRRTRGYLHDFETPDGTEYSGTGY